MKMAKKRKSTSTLMLEKAVITRESLAKTLSNSAKLKLAKTSQIVDSIIDLLSGYICDENEVKIRLFGTFSSKSKAERIGRNPKTMEEAKIPARKVIKFKVATTLKKRINDNINNII